MRKPTKSSEVGEALCNNKDFSHENVDNTVKYSPTLFPNWNPFPHGRIPGYDLPYDMESRVNFNSHFGESKSFDRSVIVLDSPTLSNNWNLFAYEKRQD